jgi:hypothetical protein
MDWRVNLRQRLLLLTGIALLPSVAIMAVYESSMRSTRLAEAETYVQRMSEVAQGEMFRALTGAGTLMIAMGESPDLMASLERCAAYAAGVRAELRADSRHRRGRPGRRESSAIAASAR